MKSIAAGVCGAFVVLVAGCGGLIATDVDETSAQGSSVTAGVDPEGDDDGEKKDGEKKHGRRHCKRGAHGDRLGGHRDDHDDDDD